MVGSIIGAGDSGLFSLRLWSVDVTDNLKIEV